MTFVGRYYAYLQRKCLESEKYSGLSEMRWQVLPWLGATGALIALAIVAFPNGGVGSDILWTLAFAIWFAGIAFVGIAFTRAGMKRKKLETSDQRGEC